MIKTGNSGDEVNRASIGVKTSASSRISTSMIVGAGRRYNPESMLLISREAGE